jgi:hypothetical protein
VCPGQTVQLRGFRLLADNNSDKIDIDVGEELIPAEGPVQEEAADQARTLTVRGQQERTGEPDDLIGEVDLSHVGTLAEGTDGPGKGLFWSPPRVS